LDGTKISQEFRDLVGVLQDADEALIAAQAAFNAEYLLYQEWVKGTPEPTSNSRRAHRRWDRRQDKYIRGSRFLETQDAQVEACEVHRNARKAIAEYRARDMNELIHKACLVCVFEGNFDDKSRGYMRPIVAVGVALDLARMSIGVSA
jgi:hypothetical protein